MAAAAEKGTLTNLFTQAVKLVTVGLAAAVAWQVFLDPLFFPILHDPTNSTAVAWRYMIDDWFGWITDIVGFTGDSGLLQTDFAQDMLAPYYPIATPEAAGAVMGVPDAGFSLDAL